MLLKPESNEEKPMYLKVCIINKKICPLSLPDRTPELGIGGATFSVTLDFITPSFRTSTFEIFDDEVRLEESILISG